MEDLQDKIIELMDLFDGEVTTADKIDRPQQALDREMFEDANKRLNKAGGGMLVQPSADGSRPGYAKQKSLTKREQNIFNNYLKTRKEVGLSVPSDDLKMKIKSKVRVGTIDNQTIKNLKETYRYENESQSLRYDTKLKRWEKTAGRDKQNYIQKKGETKSEFLRRVANIASRSQEIASKKQSKATAKTRSYIDNWTKNWLDNNLEKYGVRDFDKMTADLKKDWQKNIKNLKIDTGFKKNLSTSFGLPSVTVPMTERAGGSAFNYGNTTFYTLKERSDKVSQWRRLFYENKINTIPGFKDKLLDYFNFISKDKRGLYNSPGGQTIKAYKDIVDRDVIYILSPDAQLVGSSKNLLFNSIDDNFSKSYNTYITKVNRSEQWKKSAALIEKTLGLKPNYIQNSMKKEKRALAKLFNVKELPTELRYTLEHGQGISAAAATGNKEIMQRAVDDLIGTTIKQNTALGFGGFEQNRNALIRDITAGVNVKDNLSSLNKLTADAYKDFGIKDKVYSLQDGQLTSKNISPATTREERFAQYFKEIDKTTEGNIAIKKQYGNLKNLLAKIGCPNKVPAASGGRIGYKDGPDVCPSKGLEKVRTGMQNSTPAQLKNFDKLVAGVRAIGASNIMKFGVIPEALFEGALIADKMASEGDSLAQSLRSSYLAIPFQAMGLAKTYEEGRRDEILAAAPESQKGQVQDVFNMQDSLNRKNQLRQEMFNLQEQKKQTDAISDGSFGYVGDTQDLDNRILKRRQELEGLYDDPRSKLGKVSRDEKLLTGSPLDLNIKDQLTMDAYKSAVEKADADRASNILFAPGTGLEDVQIKKRMSELPVTPEYAKEQLQATGDFFGTGYTPLALNNLFTLLGREDPRFGFDETGKYSEEKGLNDYMNYLRTLNFAENFRDEKAKGGRAGFKFGTRKGVLSLIEEGVKKTPKDTTTELDKLIKKTLDEDFLDKKDAIIDTLNAKIAKERKNYPYNVRVFEEPSQLDFYDAITKSNFKTKTGPFFDYQKRKNKAGGGLLKQAGDRSGAPPVSGPNSQGLQGLLNRVKKI